MEQFEHAFGPRIDPTTNSHVSVNNGFGGSYDTLFAADRLDGLCQPAILYHMLFNL